MAFTGTDPRSNDGASPRPARGRGPAALAVLCASLLAAGLSARTGRADARESLDADLVQSVPAGTDLAAPGLATTAATWVRMIGKAERSIDCAQFYVSNREGSALEPVLLELERAAARGVRIRFLLSNKLLDQDPETLERLRAMPGTQVRILDLQEITGGILHAKYWVIDGSEVFVGSQNFDWRALTHIHELGLRLRDAEVARRLAGLFESDWQVAATGKPPKLRGPPGDDPAPADSTVQLVASPPKLTPPNVRPALGALVELLDSARSTVRIQLLEYAPTTPYDDHWPVIDDALRAAAARGVQIQLLVSHWNTARAVIGGLKALHAVEGIEVRVTTLPLAAEGFIPYARVCHSKFLVVDDAVLWVGTSNWSKGYFESSRNVELIVRDSSLAEQGAGVFARLWSSPYAARFDPGRNYPKPRKGE